MSHILLTVINSFHIEYRPRTSPLKSGRRKGVSPGQPTKHDAVICGRRNVQNMERVSVILRNSYGCEWVWLLLADQKENVVAC